MPNRPRLESSTLPRSSVGYSLNREFIRSPSLYFCTYLNFFTYFYTYVRIIYKLFSTNIVKLVPLYVYIHLSHWCSAKQLNDRPKIHEITQTSVCVSVLTDCTFTVNTCISAMMVITANFPSELTCWNVDIISESLYSILHLSWK